MNGDKRPLSVTILGCLYLAIGIIGFVYHGKEFLARSAFQSDIISIEITEFIAILCGAFILRGHNWARWLAVAWIAFHVILSAFHSLSELAVHTLFCAVIAWILFRPRAAKYFRGAQPLRAG